MKVFERDCSYNFIDRKNVFVGFRNTQQCCEDFGYCFTTDEPRASNDRGCYEPSESELDQYVFDPSYFKEFAASDDGGGDGGTAVFRLTCENEKPLFLILYNYHNGWYSHGFEMKVRDQITYSGSL